MIGAILSILGFLFSLLGITMVLAGVVLFLSLPLISLVTNIKAFSHLFLRLGGIPIRRAAFVVSEHNDAIFRQMKFDGIGVETVTIDGETKVAEDPDSALHYWNGIKIALMDEEHGVLFDPRHAAVGMRKRLKENHDEWEYLSTTPEWEDFGVEKWLPGVFEMPTKHELVDLSAVQELIDGGERSEFAERVEELYKHSRAPFKQSASATKFLYPIMSFAIMFGGIWFMTSQFGGPNSSISFGLALLFSLTRPSAPDPPDIDWRKAASGFALVLTVGLVIVGMAVFLGPMFAASVIFAVLLGMALLPILTIITMPSKMVSGALSKLYFKLGFLGYKEPVFEWTPAKYRLREYDDLDTTETVNWYNLFGTVVGFTYEPGPSSWGAEPISHDKVEAHRGADVATDGGSSDSNLPPKYARTEGLKRDTYGGYVPKRLKQNAYYIRSGIAMNRFADSATGEKSLRKLLEAKEKEGDPGSDLDDSTVFKATLVTGLLGVVGGIGIFIVPAFL